MKSIESWLFETIGDKTKIVSMAFHFVNHLPDKESETRNLGIVTKVRLYSKTKD